MTAPAGSSAPNPDLPDAFAGDAFILPLSFAQQRLWFLDQLVPGSAFYNIHGALRLGFAVDVDAVRAALAGVVARHEVLRTTFAVLDGEPVQVVAPHRDIALWVRSLRDLPPDQRDSQAHRLATGEARQPFDLTRGPLLRAGLIELDNEQWVFVVTVHHIVADGWSMGVFFRELSALYTAHTTGRPAELAELAVHYGDYATWQRDTFHHHGFDDQLRYWTHQLADLPTVDLPADRPRPTLPTFAGARHHLHLDHQLTTALRALADDHNATLFMVLAAGYLTLLHRYTTATDIPIGIPIAGRDRPELEPLIGFFVNTLVLRVDLTGQPTFTELIHRVRHTALDAYANQDLPFDKLVEELHPERDLSRNPLCQTMFQLQALPPEGAGERMDLPPDRGASSLDLVLSLFEELDGVSGFVEYSTELFDAARIHRLGDHYTTLLHGATTNPHQPITTLTLTTPTETAHLDHLGHGPHHPRAATTIIDHLRDHATRHPHHPAIVTDHTTLTYRQLDHTSDHLARHLRAAGARPDTLIAVHLPRTPHTLTTLIAVLKAGAAFVPLDPTYPPARLHHMLTDSHAPLLITDTLPPTTATPDPATATTLHLPTLLTTPPPEVDLPPPQPDHLAYAIYTSGSTGRPKGVTTDHAALMNVVHGQGEVLGVDAASRVLQFAPLCFDASVFEVCLAFGRGATLCVPNADDFPGPELAGFIGRHDVDTVVLPPSALRVLGPPASLTPLRTVMVAGERCPADLVSAWAATGADVYNLYGPTEATIWATAYRGHDGETEPVPIGRPIPNVDVAVLDDHGQPVPIGIAGELHIGGTGLARGYLGLPDATTRAFGPHPHHPDRRLYRTGDRARWRDDGHLDYLGRTDDQVKVRGHRIELGEIETALRRHPAVTDATAVVGDGEAAEAIYAVLEGRNGEVSAAELRSFLADQLPASMLPSGIVWVGELPRLPNGKADRAAAAAVMPRHQVATPFVAPATPMEELVVDLCAQLFERDRVSATDHFFRDLGGHSLLAIRLVTRLRDALGVDVAVRTVFETPVLADLAATLDRSTLDRATLDRATLDRA